MMKQSLYIVMCACLTLCLGACQDDLAEWGAGPEAPMAQTRVSQPAHQGDNTGLILMDDGTWKASRRVPLTGMGRTIGNMSPGLLSVVGNSPDLGPIVDNDLSNKASIAGLASANALYGQIVSVKDMYRTYSGGQQAGFVYEDGKSGLLTAEVLKLFTLTLYNDGKLLQTFNISESGGVLGLNLANISTSNGEAQHALAVEVPAGMQFDEIALGVAGVDASVLQALHIYYAFVGETPMRTTVKNTPDAYEKATIYKGSHNWSNWAGQSDMLDSDPDNGPVIELLNGALNFLKGGNRVTINFGEEIPAGSEVGFVYSAGDVLNLGLGNAILMETYGANPDHGILGGMDDPIESYNVGNVLGASLIGGGKGANSFVVTKPFHNLYLNITGLRVKLGMTQYHYAYTRAKTEVDATSYFNFPASMNITSSGLALVKPQQGNLVITVTKQPQGADAKYDEAKGRLTGMTKDGDYEITFVYTDETDKHRFTQTAVLTKQKEDAAASAGCNQLITNQTHGAVVAPDAGSGGLCVICGTAEGTDKLVDNDVNSCMVHFGALELAVNKNIVTVNQISGFSDSQTPKVDYRVGFIVQVSKEFLNLNALNFLYVALYNNGVKQETQVSGSRPTVDLGLLNGDQGKLRVGVTVKGGTPFDEIRLYNAGVLGLNFNTLRLYGLFYEPADENCSSRGVSEACMELVTPASNNAQIWYPKTHFTGLAGVAEGTYSLDNVLDDDKESFVTIPKISLGGSFSLGVKFNEMPANQPIGMMIQNMGAVADANLLKALIFEAYHQGERVVGYADDKQLLNVSVISHGDKSFLELQPDKPYDEIRLYSGELLELLGQLKVYGVYTRVDLDGDGIPDCGEDEQNPDSDGSGIYPQVSNLHVCAGEDAIQVSVTGGKQGQTYVLKSKKYSSEMLDDATPDEKILTIEYDGGGKISLGKLPAGIYLIDFYPEAAADKPNYTNFTLYVHPRQATWQGGSEHTDKQHDWNHWKNWLEGAPWGCTDVVIPAGCANYPVLDSQSENNCARIQFEANEQGQTGEVVNTHYLTYDEAWVDVALPGKQPTLLAAPLKAVYTGDVFALKDDRYPVTGAAAAGAADYTASWPVYTQTTDLVKGFRFAPQVYQHTFGGPVQNITGNGTEALQPGSQNWTGAFNLVAQPYEQGAAFLVRMGKGDEQTDACYRIRWPKRYATYHYYQAGQQTELPGREETVNRTGAGRFIYEDADGKFTFPLRLERVNERPGDVYLFGNPFMAHLNLKHFFEANVQVGEVWLLQNDTYREIKRESVSETDLLAPMEGFLVKLRSPYAERNRYRCYIHLVENMLQQKN